MQWSCITGIWLKCLCIGVYKAPSQNSKYFLDNLSKNLGELICQHEKLCSLPISTEPLITKILNTFNLECLLNKPICFQSENLSYIDLILTNTKDLFKYSEVIQVVIFDHHSFVVTSIKIQLVKGNAKIKIYRDNSKLNMYAFKKIYVKVWITEACMNTRTSKIHFSILLIIMRQLRKKIFRFNNNNFLTKTLRKTIMRRSKLKMYMINLARMKTVLAIKIKGIPV